MALKNGTPPAFCEGQTPGPDSNNPAYKEHVASGSDPLRDVTAKTSPFLPHWDYVNMVG